MLQEKKISFSVYAREEINEMKNISIKALNTLQNYEYVSVEQLTQISALEQKIDDMTRTYRQNQLVRMHNGTCSDEACIIYSEMLTDFERIGDHLLNIGQELAHI